jgi:DNA primase
VNDLGVASTPDERQRMLGANAAAARFFRRELLRATYGWPAKYLNDAGIAQVLETGSTWQVGYAPDTWSNLVDHLQSEGFSHATMVRAGLMTWTDGGDAVDRYRDQLMFVARDHRLAPAGFVGLGQDGTAVPQEVPGVVPGTGAVANRIVAGGRRPGRVEPSSRARSPT